MQNLRPCKVKRPGQPDLPGAPILVVAIRRSSPCPALDGKVLQSSAKKATKVEIAPGSKYRANNYKIKSRSASGQSAMEIPFKVPNPSPALTSRSNDIG
jgi:hypothetical protein